MTAPEREALVKQLRHLHRLTTVEVLKNAADMIEALSASPAVTVTEGWKLVPIKPTPEMLAAGECEPGEDWITVEHCWNAMLAASPASPRKSERDAVLEEAAQAFEKASVEAGRQECCGHYRGGDRFDDPPECCGDPDFVISNAVGAAAIRALKSTTPQTGS